MYLLAYPVRVQLSRNELAIHHIQLMTHTAVYCLPVPLVCSVLVRRFLLAIVGDHEMFGRRRN